MLMQALEAYTVIAAIFAILWLGIGFVALVDPERPVWAIVAAMVIGVVLWPFAMHRIFQVFCRRLREEQE